MPGQATDERSRPPEPLFHFLRNRCSTSSGFRVPLPGFAVPLPPESMFHFLRIPCSTSSGIPRRTSFQSPPEQPTRVIRRGDRSGQRRQWSSPTASWAEKKLPPAIESRGVDRPTSPLVAASTCHGQPLRSRPARPDATRLQGRGSDPAWGRTDFGTVEQSPALVHYPLPGAGRRLATRRGDGIWSIRRSAGKPRPVRGHARRSRRQGPTPERCFRADVKG